MQGIQVQSDSDALELVNYFKTDMQSNSFNKIHFVQGIKPWVKKQRPPGQQNLQQPNLNQQVSFNPMLQQTQNMMSTQQMGQLPQTN